MGKTVEKEEAEAEVEMWRYIFGFVEMAVVKCAIELGVAEIMEAHGGSVSLSSLSSAVGCSTSGLNRIMRFLVNRRVFKEAETSEAEKCYQQTPLSRRLMSRGENGMADLLLLESSPVMLAPWHALSARLRGTVSAPFDAANGEEIWGYAASHPSHSKLINDAMACDARVAVSAIVNDCPEVFDGVSSLVDVGGGDGTSLRTLIKSRPLISGINFDLPYVVSAAPKCDGVEFVGGDMFDTVPTADAAFIMWVLHDWGDEECIKILENCREAIPRDKGKVIIVEAVIEEKEKEKEKENEEGGNSSLKDVGLMLDMVMMAHTTTGKERTLKEWDYVIKKAGFSRYTVKPLPTVQSVIEAYP